MRPLAIALVTGGLMAAHAPAVQAQAASALRMEPASGVTPPAHRADAPAVEPAPRFATITAACTPANNPQVRPPRIEMSRADHVEWREPSGRAVEWVISPKDPEDWPFAHDSYTGTRDGPAVTPQPRADAVADHPYAYEVTITCADGSTQVIDPDIVIGEAVPRPTHNR